MPRSASNDNGRALEFAVTKQLQMDGATLTPTALRHQTEYKKYFDSLLPRIQSEFKIASVDISKWVGSSLSIANCNVDNSLDSDPGAADVLIRQGVKSLDISLKHNHDGLKHQRPYALAQQCGFAVGSPQDTQHRSRMKSVEMDYRRDAVGLVNYSDDDSAKFNMLEAVCRVCCDSINQWATSDPGFVSYLFGFLVANDCYQAIVDTTGTLSIEVHDYNGLNMPNSVSASVNTAKGSTRRIYLHMDFDNDFELRARLHTASSKISAIGKQLSLKFDTRKYAGVVPVVKLR